MTITTRPQRPPDGLRSRLGTEFGDVLEAMVRATPGAVAAVLSDEDGDAIDFVHDPGQIDELDVQLFAAQTGLSVLQLEATYARHKIPNAALLVETQLRCLITSVVATSYVLAMLTERRANIGRALQRFEAGRAALANML